MCYYKCNKIYLKGVAMAKIIKRAAIAGAFIVLAIIMLASCTKDDGTIKYKSVKGGYEVVGLVDKNVENIVIPESFDGKAVVGIAREAFRGSSVKGISIPESVKSIGLNAFEFCLSLTRVELASPDSLADASLENFYSSPFNNGAELYVGGSKITDISFDGEKIGDYAYAGCSSIEKIAFSGVKSVGVGSFKDCGNISTVDFGNALEAISSSAFSGNSIISVALPESCGSIGHSAFSYNAKLESVALSSAIVKIPDRAFSNCSALESINIDGVEEIGAYAFYRCEGLAQIDLSEKLKRIGEYAYYDSGLEKINVPEGSALEFIGEAAFRGCTSLEEIYLDRARGLKVIEKSAFEFCGSLTELTLPSSLESLGDWAFSGCDDLKYTMSGGVGYIGNAENKFVMAHKFIDHERTRIAISDKAKFVHSGAFKDAKHILSVRMVGGVVSIGTQAFAFCSSIEEFVFPSTLRIIGDGAAMGCTALSSVKFMGTSDQWNQSSNPGYVKKGTNWRYNAGSYKISYNFVP